MKAFDLVETRHGLPSICIPAAGINRDHLAVKVDKQTGRAVMYPLEDYHLLVEINLIAPVYWALELVARIAEQRARQGQKRWAQKQGSGPIIFIGSVSRREPGPDRVREHEGRPGGAAATLAKEAMYYGVRSATIHPGFTDTPMVGAPWATSTSRRTSCRIRSSGG